MQAIQFRDCEGVTKDQREYPVMKFYSFDLWFSCSHGRDVASILCDLYPTSLMCLKYNHPSKAIRLVCMDDLP